MSGPHTLVRRVIHGSLLDVAFREDIRRMRNVLKSASGADSFRIGALGI